MNFLKVLYNDNLDWSNLDHNAIVRKGYLRVLKNIDYSAVKLNSSSIQKATNEFF
jgi:hypothetical protein